MKWFTIVLRYTILLSIISHLFFHPAGVNASVEIRHVTTNGGDTGDCTDIAWDDACTLQYALSISQSGDEIWVKAGIYLPTDGGDKEASFSLKNGVEIYGGFSGTELNRSDRHWSTNVSVLSGDLAGNDSGFARWDNLTLADNSYHVVTANNVSNTAVLDGFTIRGGNANGGNFGDDPFSGGGVSLHTSSPVLRNLIIVGNTAHIGNGGGMLASYDCNPWLINVLFSGNTAGLQGGALHIQNGSPVLTNITITGNEAAETGGAISSFYGSIFIRNSIIWGNVDFQNQPIKIMNPESLPTIVFSDVESGCPSAALCDSSDLFIYPNFVNAAGADGIYGTYDDNPRLQETSPLIDQGSNSVTNPALPTTDLDGQQRIVGGTVDMGTYEQIFTNHPPVSNNQTFRMLRNLAFSGQLTAMDIDGDSLVFQLYGDPPAGIFDLNEDGSFSFTSVPGFTGLASFQFKVKDPFVDPVGPYTATIKVLYPTYLPYCKR